MPYINPIGPIIGSGTNREVVSTVTAADFDAKVLRAAGPIAVEFMSPACPHCRRMEPVMQGVAAALEGRVRFYQVIVQLDPDLTNRYRIMGTPTFVMFQNGREVGRANPGPDAAELRAAVLGAFPR